jgi:colicin import membrane protein
MHMEPPKETLERIFSAADALYEQADRAAFPTVDAVRKTARVNMNDASAGMKQWRRIHTTNAASVAVPVPERVQQSGGAALAVLWREAQDLAHESLRAAQAGWEAERADAETLNKQMADAYETQAVELEAAQVGIAQLKADAEHAATDKARLDTELADSRRQLASALAAAERTEARAIEIERRAAELRTELDHSHQVVTQARAELADMRDAHAVEIEGMRGALAAAQARFESERDKAQKEASHAHEEAAILRVKVEALKEQNTILMRSVSRERPADASNDLG